MSKWWQMKVGDPGLAPLAEALDGPHNRLCDPSDQALTMQATGPAGWQAKAELLRHFLLVECGREGKMVFDSSEQELTWSLICDMTGGRA